MTIHNPKAYAASQWDWQCLNGCFGDTKIAPTDIDGFVERNAKFLIIETKLPGVPIPKGQELTFQRLVENGSFTVLVVWGHPGVPQEMRLITRYTDLHYQQADINQLRTVVGKWFDFANRQQPTVTKRFGQDLHAVGY